MSELKHMTESQYINFRISDTGFIRLSEVEQVIDKFSVDYHKLQNEDEIKKLTKNLADTRFAIEDVVDFINKCEYLKPIEKQKQTHDLVLAMNLIENWLNAEGAEI